MSGGVDSSVAALLLKEGAHDVLGVSMQVWDYRNNGGSRSRATCCSPDDFNDARRVAGLLSMPFYVFDFENVFREKVIDRFVSSYRNGLTPNPCVDCNNNVKFKELRTRALTLGGSHVATGHYAQIEERADGLHLLRGADSRKDQSYFLYGLTQEELAQTLFPVGHLTKEQVREEARRSGLNTAEKAESQDICFVEGSVDSFITAQGGRSPAGRIVDTTGRPMGTHEGIHAFTVGQRKGLQIGGVDQPLYVVELIPEENLVVVGHREHLERRNFFVDEVSWVAPQILSLLASGEKRTLACRAQVRYRHKGLPVQVTIDPASPQRVEVTFGEEWSALSPGQAAVFYDEGNQEVLGGGRIARSAQQEMGTQAKGRTSGLLAVVSA
jgi:tRNA-specific 2-thiouridylase